MVASFDCLNTAMPLRCDPEHAIIRLMRVLLVYSNQSRELVPAPPVGLSYVATATRAAGHEVRLLDLAFSQDLEQELAAGMPMFSRPRMPLP